MPGWCRSVRRRLLPGLDRLLLLHVHVLHPSRRPGSPPWPKRLAFVGGPVDRRDEPRERRVHEHLGQELRVLLSEHPAEALDRRGARRSESRRPE